MPVAKFDFLLGDKVRILNTDIIGPVVGCLCRLSGETTYEVTWFHNGQCYTQWFAKELLAFV